MDRFCVKCGSELVNGVCPNCSAAQTAPQYQQPDMQYQQQYQQQPQYQQPAVEINPNDERFKKIFTSPKEKFVCALGNSYLFNYLNNYLSTGSVVSTTFSQTFAIISDKRVYLKGKAYLLDGRRLRTERRDRIVDLKDVTGTDIQRINPLALRVMGILFTIIGVIFLTIVASNSGRYGNRAAVTIGGIIAGVFWPLGITLTILYFINRLMIMWVYFGGGSFGIALKGFSQREIDNFQKALRTSKDKAVEDAENATANAMREVMSNVSAQQPVPQAQPAVSAADELAKYAQLYKDGLITEQEFADIKAKLFTRQL